MASPWDFQYVISGWMLVALVVLPFCFGVLYGMKLAFRRFVMKMLKYMPADKLKAILDKKEGEVENGGLDATAP